MKLDGLDKFENWPIIVTSAPGRLPPAHNGDGQKAARKTVPSAARVNQFISTGLSQSFDFLDLTDILFSTELLDNR